MIELDKIYNEDCLEGMRRIPDGSVDAIICDLPYGTTCCKWDSVIPFEPLWEQYQRVLKQQGNIVLFAAGMFTHRLIASNTRGFRYKLIWKKNVPTGMCSAKTRPMKYYEEICVFGAPSATYNPQMKERVGKRKECYRYDHYCADSHHLALGKVMKRYDPMKVQPSDILEFDVVPNRSGKLHPTQKPVELIRYLIRTYSNPGDTILDNCIGSGTTAIAAMREGRHFVGFELNEEYFAKAVERIERERGYGCCDTAADGMVKNNR